MDKSDVAILSALLGILVAVIVGVAVLIVPLVTPRPEVLTELGCPPIT